MLDSFKKKHLKKSKLEDVKGIQEESASLAAANEISTDPVVSGLDCTFTLTDENTAVEVFRREMCFYFSNEFSEAPLMLIFALRGS